jgi:hypothetical protein
MDIREIVLEDVKLFGGGFLDDDDDSEHLGLHCMQLLSGFR